MQNKNLAGVRGTRFIRLCRIFGYQFCLDSQFCALPRSLSNIMPMIFEVYLFSIICFRNLILPKKSLLPLVDIYLDLHVVVLGNVAIKVKLKSHR